MTSLEITVGSAIAVSIIGGIVSIIVSIIGGKYLLASKRAERIATQQVEEIKHHLEDIYKIIPKPPKDYEWLYDKYTHLDKLHTGYCVIDPARFEEYISDGICQTLGRSRAQFGKHVKDVSRFVDPADVVTFRQYIEQLLKGEREGFMMQKKIKDADGEYFVFDIHTIKDGAFILSVYNLK